MATAARRAVPLILVIILALALKSALLAFDAVPLNSDEAIVGLMARHILQGERPVFFYGQAYMGSLDAWLVAGTFTVMGESVAAIRMTQVLLFAAVLITSYVVALRLTGSRLIALVTLMLMAVPPVLLTLYTTATLGGYGEAMLLGNLLLWWGHRLGREGEQCYWLWLAWGFIAGLGFWAFGLTLVYFVPVTLWLMWHLRARPWRGYWMAVTGSAIGSLPWWLGNLDQLGVGVAELAGSAVNSTATAGSFLGNVIMRVFSFFVLGLPALFGLRFPWSIQGPPLWLAFFPLILYLGALGYALRKRNGDRDRSGRTLLWGVCVALLLGFVLTPFGGDPSGRYFLPLYLPLFIFTADVIVALRARIRYWAWGLLVSVLIFNLIGTVQAAIQNPPGITTQFEAITQVDHHYDGELIDFLRAHGGTRGYGNYWVSYPIAFLSKEEIILIPRLPYKADLRYTFRDDRYLPYQEQVEASPRVVYVTTNHPVLDGILRERFAASEVSFREEQIGSYHVFYNLARKVMPDELGLARSPDAGD